MFEQDRHDLDDARWALIEPYLPDRTPRRGGWWADHRKVVDGIRWRTRTGCPWRDLPAVYGHWQTVYGRHRRWSGDSTWAAVLDGLRAGADRAQRALDTAGAWVVSVDSTVVAAYADAAGARHIPPRDVAAALLVELAAAVPVGLSRGPAQPEPALPSRPAHLDGGGASGGGPR